MEWKWSDAQLAEEMAELVLVFNEKGDILFGNRAAAEKLEYDKEELTECGMPQIFRKDFQRTKDGEPFFDAEKLEELAETSMYRKNSSCFSVKIRIFPSGEEGVSVLLAEDLSFQKDMSARIRKLKEEQQLSQKARDEFTANVTHELRTPVNGIRGHVMNLMDEAAEEQKKTLEIILYCCDNMSVIINNILDFAKMGAGKFSIEEKEFDFYKMMDRVISTHIAEINKKELRLGVDIDEKIPQFLIGDELRLTQILNNLISNAVKFTIVGYINIAVSRSMQMEEEVELFFMVKDSGIGISEQERDKLFQNFSQVDASITRRFGGTGLGLVITKQLVELMHGDIQVESEKGKGSAFTFSVRLGVASGADDGGSRTQGSWVNFSKSEGEADAELFLAFGGEDNREELKKRMDKLVLSIEMGAWDRAEMLSDMIKELVKNGDEEIRKLVLRMEMAVRKGDYERSMERYETVKKALAGRFGEL